MVGASLESVFRKEQNFLILLASHWPVRSEEKRCEKQPYRHQDQRRKRGGGAPGAQAETLLWPMEKNMVTQVVPLQPMEDRGATIHTVACGGPHSAAGGRVLKLQPVQCTHRSRFRQELWPVGDLRWSNSFVDNFSLGRGPMLEQFVKDHILWEGHHYGAGKEREEEGVTERTPIPHSPALLRGRRRCRSQK